MNNSKKARAFAALLTVPLLASMGASVVPAGTAMATSSDNAATSASEETGSSANAASEASTSAGTADTSKTSASSSTASTSSDSTKEASSAASSASKSVASASSASTQEDAKTATENGSEYVGVGAPSNADDGYDHTYNVWDLAGDYLTSTDSVTYNNLLSVDTINGFYGSSIAAGTAGQALGGFDSGTGLSFYSAKTNNRLRTTNKNLTRYDEKSKTDPEGNVYRGYIYSNSSATALTGMTLSNLEAGDIVRIMAGSNSNSTVYGWGKDTTAAPEQTASFTDIGNVDELTFYAAEDGSYSFWSTDEKLVVARVYVEKAEDITVSGDIAVPDGFDADGAKLTFSQTMPNGDVLRTVTADVVDDGDGTFSYSAALQKMYDYSVELTGANGYVIDSTLLKDGAVSIENISDDTMTQDLTIAAVDVVTLTGEFENLSAKEANALKLTIVNEDSKKPYEASLTKTADTNKFTLELESGETYDLTASGVDDYTLVTTTITADKSGEQNIVFKAKDTHSVAVTVSGPSEAELANLTLTFTILETPITGALNEDYVYSYTGADVLNGKIALRDGQYHIDAKLDGYEMALTSDLKVKGADTDKTIVMTKTSSDDTKIAYAETLTVGSGKEYQTIGDALDAVRKMDRDADTQRVTIEIDPGDYQEMLYVDVANVSLVNASDDPSIALADNGTSIAANAVRITSYYGHGYTYYSMGDDYRYDADVLAVNKENGYATVTNPGSGTATMWNATVEVEADGFEASGIIFENSFNQYISGLEAEDTIVAQSGAKEGSNGTRDDLAKGSTAVQQKSYVERAAALALGNSLSDITFDNCKIIGRQDTLYGGKSTYAEFTGCSVYGAVDYIFGAMTAIFNKCDLVFNTTDDKNDVGYITAAQQSSGRGFLMYECHVTSVKAGTDVDAAYYSYTTSKPGYLGRPWQANTSEVVFYNTTIDACDSSLAATYGSQSLIQPAGWLNTLGGEGMMYEYGTTETSGVDNSANRIPSWTTWTTSKSVLTTPYLQDGTEITLDAFREDKNAAHSWAFTTYGSSVSTDYDTYSVAADGTVTVASTNAKGKLVPASTDGLAFYYTTIDASKENFTLEADVTVDSWKLSNGQEGFGMMAADAVGTNGDTSTFWNNSYMLAVTKTAYTSDEGNAYTMKLGVGAQEKKGVTAANLATIKSGDISAFSSTMVSLEKEAATEGLAAGTYNLVGNYSQATGITDVANLTTTFHMSIRRNNTGYVLTYSDANGNVIGSQLFYHPDNGDNLTMIDDDNIYVGFFASRNATISVKNINLTTIAPSKDDAKQEHPITYTDLSAGFETADFANSSNYELDYYGNADGTLSIKDQEGNTVLADTAVTANTKVKTDVTLSEGANTFTGTFTPNADFKFGTYEKLSSYDTVTFTITVDYTKGTRYVYYVSPDGTSKGDGSAKNPMDIYTAVKTAEAGDKILLTGGTYNLTSTLTVERGIDGTAEAPIYLMADPSAAERPVFNFGGKCAGMVIAGDYWYFQGFDVTKSANGQKGIQLSGSNDTLDQIHTYRNGNTGIQVSRYLNTDTFEDWPANNTILNCTSFLNADSGYEDADGFAAKLTVGEGNVFDGCIAAYNADDGWDLFAKVETGAIGSVTIQNSVAYMNGYDLDANGNIIDAGNGNGFKMGGSSITGKHQLINSVAFANKAKGIDSNSCPDIKVTNSTSFNNGSFNVALYTNDAANTAFTANGIISYRNDGGVDDQFKLKGTQVESDVYGTANYYMIGGVSINSEGSTVSDSWFTSVDSAAAIGSGMTSASTDLIAGITRNADGTINMNGFLTLSSSAAANTGAVVSGASSKNVTVTKEEANKTKDNSEDLDGKFVTKWWNTYYVLSDGSYLTGLHKIDGQTYYFGSNGVLTKNSFVTVSGNTYYFDGNGQMVTGFMTKWWNEYYFASNGHLVSGMFSAEEADGSTYSFYANASGVLQKNSLINITNDDSTVSTYYFDGNGHMVTGEMERWTSHYYFGQDGVMAVSSFVTIGNNTYYFNASGRRVTGWQTIDGKKYYFGSDGAMYTGVHKIWWHTYTFGSDGVLAE